MFGKDIAILDDDFDDWVEEVCPTPTQRHRRHALNRLSEDRELTDLLEIFSNAAPDEAYGEADD